MSKLINISRLYVASSDRSIAVALQKLMPAKEIVTVDVHQKDGLSPDKKAMLENEAEVLLADVPVIMEVVESAKKLKWAESTWAGVERLVSKLNPDKPPKCLLTRCGGAFNDIMAEYVLGYILTKERSIIEVAKEQEKCFWNKTSFGSYRSLSELTLGILGVGEIGSQVARLCQGSGMKVIGVNRTIPQEDRRCPAVDMYKTLADLPEVLAECDYVCNILPSTAATRGLLSGEMFQNCQHKKSVFINIGRGDVTDEESLVKAVRSGWLGGAVLDVFPTEPLPADSPLWTLPGVLITPHIAGISLPHRVAESFSKNYKLYQENLPLKFQIDLQRGY